MDVKERSQNINTRLHLLMIIVLTNTQIMSILFGYVNTFLYLCISKTKEVLHNVKLTSQPYSIIGQAAHYDKRRSTKNCNGTA